MPEAERQASAGDPWRAADRSKHALTVFELEQPPGAVDRYADHIETKIVGTGSVGHLGQPAGRDPAHLSLFATVDRFERRAGATGRAARFDLDERQQPAVVCDQVELPQRVR